MGIFDRLFRTVWGGDVDRALRPVLAVSLAGSVASSAAYPFVGVWAVRHLHAPQASLGFAYLIGAVLAGVTGYVGGHWSDRIGRRPLILGGWGCEARTPLLALAVAGRVWVGLALIAALPVFGSSAARPTRRWSPT